VLFGTVTNVLEKLAASVALSVKFKAEAARHILQHFDHLQHGLTVEGFQLCEDRPTLSFEFTKYKE
jgi:hypothetical protein